MIASCISSKSRRHISNVMQVSLRSWNWQIIFCIQKYQISSCLYRHKQLWTLDCSFISFYSFLCTGCAYSVSFEQRLRIFLSLNWNDSGHTYSANASQVYLFLILFFSYLHIYYFLLIHVRIWQNYQWCHTSDEIVWG